MAANQAVELTVGSVTVSDLGVFGVACPLVLGDMYPSHDKPR